MINNSAHVATMVQNSLATAVVNCKVEQIFRVSDMAPDGLNGKKFCDLLDVLVSIVDTDSRNRLVLQGQLCIINKGNTLKPYLPEKKTAIVLNTPVLEYV